MLFDPPPSPLRYSDDVEEIDDDEGQLARDLAKVMLEISSYEDGGHAQRSVHAKSHALLNAGLESPKACRRCWRKGCSPGQGATTR